MGEMVLHSGAEGGGVEREIAGAVTAWRSSRDGKERPGNGNRYRFRARQIGQQRLWRRLTLHPGHIDSREEELAGRRARRYDVFLLLSVGSVSEFGCSESNPNSLCGNSD